METYRFPNLPPNLSTLHIVYFDNVGNAPDIRARLVSAAKAQGDDGHPLRAAVDFAFIDASMLVSKEHLLTALQAAALTSLPQTREAKLPAPPTPKTKSHNIHSEVLYALSPNNNITEAIRKFGVGDTTTRLVVAKFAPEGSAEEDIWRMIEGVVKGAVRPLDELDEGIEWGKVDKMYKLNELNQLKIPQEELLARKVAVVTNTVAVKHAM